jgi:hypothetical protein
MDNDHRPSGEATIQVRNEEEYGAALLRLRALSEGPLDSARASLQKAYSEAIEEYLAKRAVRRSED